MQISEQQAQEITVHERGAERALDEVEAIIAEIQERITPQALAGKAGNAVKEATVGRVGRAVDDMTDKVSETGGSFVERIRQNPIPAVLAGTGIAWLFMGGRRSARPTGREGAQLDDQSLGAQATDHVGRIVDGASTTVGEAAETARVQAGKIGMQAQEQVQRVQSGFQQMLEDNPVPVALVAAGLGALIAATVPQTAVEDQIAGQARERVTQQARQIGDKVGRVAERVQTSAGEEARKEKLV